MHDEATRCVEPNDELVDDAHVETFAGVTRLDVAIRIVAKGSTRRNTRPDTSYYFNRKLAVVEERVTLEIHTRNMWGCVQID